MSLAPNYARWGVPLRLFHCPVPFETLVSEVSQNRMVLVGLKFWYADVQQYAGHAVLVVGYSQNAQGRFLIVYDPIRGIGADWYEDLLTAYGRGSWYATWIELAE